MKLNRIFGGIILFTLTFVSVVFTGCSGKEKKHSVELTFFSNLPDRNFGQGLVEQLIIDEFMEENPDIIIKLETLDETAYKTKFHVYCHERLPDIVSVWGQRAFLEDAVLAGKLEPLDPADFKNFGFKEGTLDGFTYEGELYGLPRNTDVALFYYNERMFRDFGWKVPQSFDELFDVAEEIQNHDFVPVGMDGSDGWPLMIFFSDILYDISGKDYRYIVDHAIETHNFSDERILKALKLFCKACSGNLFQKNFTQDDYGAAQNFFLSGKSAMYYMGSWETSMAVNTTYWNEITPYIRVIKFPSINKDSPGKSGALAWYGGGYAVSADSLHKKEAVKFLKFMFAPERLSRLGLKNAVGISAQNESDFLYETDVPCLTELVRIAESADDYSGSPVNDRGNLDFKYLCEANILRLASGQITPEEFIKLLEQEGAY
ncbi:MAG: extracellular solute-binding protein [Treponema sp.]|nr:extracellular solute-binding protein [Treponema sp.]